METKLYRMNPECDSSSAAGMSTSSRSRSPAEQFAGNRSTNVQSQAISQPTGAETPPDPDSRPVTCSSSFSTTTSSSDHQTSLPCSTHGGSDQSRENGEFATADPEFGGGYSNAPPALLATQATTSLSQNNLLDKVDNNSIHSAARSSSPPAAHSPGHDASGCLVAVSDSLIESLNRQLSTPPSSTSPKLDSNSLSAEKLSRVDVRDEECLTDKLTEQLKEQLAEHLNQQLISQQLDQGYGQQMNDQQLNETVSSPEEPTDEDEEGSEEECSSEEEVAKTAGAATNSKKRSRSGLQSHLCSKKRRKQSNPVRCDFEPTEKAVLNDANKLSQFSQLNQLSQQLNQQLKQLLTEQLKSQLSGAEPPSNVDHPKGQVNENPEKRKQLRERNAPSRGQPENEEEQEEGLVCKFPNALSGAANATVRFFLSNHQVGSSNGKNGDAGESPINFTYYLAAAAAVATSASLKGTKHCLNYCKECCCPFLSTEHERQYRQLERQVGRESGRESGLVASQQPPNNPERSVFAQQLQNLVQQSKLMQEMESVFGSSYEAGQLPQRNAIDAMQLIKQLGESRCCAFLQFLS